MNEFKLYDRITNGDLRPHLERFDSQDGLEDLEDEFYTIRFIVENNSLKAVDQNFNEDFHGYKAGDRFEIEINVVSDPKNWKFE